MLHIPQLYYYCIASTTFVGWPILISTPDDILGLGAACSATDRKHCLVSKFQLTYDLFIVPSGYGMPTS